MLAAGRCYLLIFPKALFYFILINMVLMLLLEYELQSNEKKYVFISLIYLICV
jgi:hypothetical protein